LNFPDEWDKDQCLDEAFKVEDMVNNRYQEFAEDVLNAEEHHFDIEFEKLYERFFQSGAKKRYAGFITWSEGQHVEKQDITGYKYRRSDASPIANETQEKVLRMICQGDDPKDVGRYVHEQIRRVLRREVALEEIGIPEGIGKNMDNYQSPTHSVRAAKFGNLLLGTTFTSNTKPRRYYLEDMEDEFWRRQEKDWADPNRDALYNVARSDGYVRYIAVEDPENLPGEAMIDWEKHKNKNLKQTLSSITSALGLDWDELEESSTQSGLDEFASA
jgi:DNA polymerase elongation subunit (family B)